MGLILDTCALLSLSGIARRKLRPRTLEVIRSIDSLHVSACSLFEIALKVKREQLKLTPFDTPQAYWDEAISSYECEVLAVTAEDFAEAVNLPEHHSDPFDRIIIAQAIRTRSEIATYDRHYAAYSIKLHG